MIAGETVRVDCNACMKEFEVTLEPKCKGNPTKRMGEGTVNTCPFCGEDDVNVQDDLGQ